MKKQALKRRLEALREYAGIALALLIAVPVAAAVLDLCRRMAGV